MRASLVVPVVGIALCFAPHVAGARGTSFAAISSVTQDETWTVIEYPEGQEVVVELKAAESIPDARGTARVLRNGNETTITLDVSGVTGDESTHQVYVVDSLGSASLLGTITASDGAGSLQGKTVLSKFMLVVSPEADLTTISSGTRVALRSTVPNGFAVVPKENGGVTESMEPSAAPTTTEAEAKETTENTPAYDVPVLKIGSLKRDSNRSMRANFSSGYQAAKADIVIRPQKNGATLIKMRFTNLKEVPEGTQYLLWRVGQDNSYTLLGHLTKVAGKREAVIDAESDLTDFGLFITFENADASSPAGTVVATIIQ